MCLKLSSCSDFHTDYNGNPEVTDHEIIIIACQNERSRELYEAVTVAGHFHEHGKGLAFMLPVLATNGLTNDD
jgi:hypothetical protein